MPENLTGLPEPGLPGAPADTIGTAAAEYMPVPAGMADPEYVLSAAGGEPAAAAERHPAELAGQCDHRFATHHHDGQSIRLCALCGEPDWDHLAGQVRAGADRLVGEAAKHMMAKAASARLRSDLADLINRRCAENGSDTPDFVLADLMVDVLAAFDRAVMARDRWYGHHHSPGGAVEPLGEGLPDGHAPVGL